MKVSQIFESMEGMGATTAGNVAAFPSRLSFDQEFDIDPNNYGFKLVKQPSRSKRTSIIRRALGVQESVLSKFDVSTAMLYTIDAPVCEAEYTSVINDVNNKINNARKQRDISDTTGARNTSTFGLQDAQGNIVRVTVNRAEAVEFEASLNSILSATENPKEIAEIIYILRTDFNILNVDWAAPITEDDEIPYKKAIIEKPTEGNEGDTPFDLDDMGKLDSNDELDKTADPTSIEEPAGDISLDLGGDDKKDKELGSPASDDNNPPIALQSQTVNLLQQVIELLKKETDSRAAEAELQRAKTQVELDKLTVDQQKREIERQIELAQVEEFEDREKDQSKHDRLVQRIARYRSTQQK